MHQEQQFLSLHSKDKKEKFQENKSKFDSKIKNSFKVTKWKRSNHLLSPSPPSYTNS
jgi:hypothetical protein